MYIHLGGGPPRMTQSYHRHWQIHVRNRKKQVNIFCVSLFPLRGHCCSNLSLSSDLSNISFFFLFFSFFLFCFRLLYRCLSSFTLSLCGPLIFFFLIIFIIVFTPLLFHFAVHILIYFGRRFFLLFFCCLFFFWSWSDVTMNNIFIHHSSGFCAVVRCFISSCYCCVASWCHALAQSTAGRLTDQACCCYKSIFTALQWVAGKTLTI